MPITKSAPISATSAAVGSGVSVAAGTPYTGPWIDLTGAYGAQLDVQIINGATGPTVGATIQVQTANDYNGGTPTSLATNYGGALQAGTANNGAYSWPIDIEGVGVAAVRIVVQGNTGQAVTAQGDLCKVTGI